jgi:hypothetical protein
MVKECWIMKKPMNKKQFISWFESSNIETFEDVIEYIEYLETIKYYYENMILQINDLENWRNDSEKEIEQKRLDMQKWVN